MSLKIRPIAKQDFEAIEERLVPFLRDIPKNQWQSFIDIGSVVSACKNETAITALLIEETYLLLLSFNTPWYSKEQVLQELFTFNLYGRGVPFSVIPRALVHICKDAGLDGCTSAAILNPYPERLRRIYERYGFHSQNGAMIKRV